MFLHIFSIFNFKNITHEFDRRLTNEYLLLNTLVLFYRVKMLDAGALCKK